MMFFRASMVGALVCAISALAAPKIDPELAKVLAQNDANVVPVVVYLKGRFDLSRLQTDRLSPAARAELVRKNLSAFHKESVANVKNVLDHAQGVKSVRSLWILNALVVTAPKQVIQELTQMNGIEELQLDRPREIDSIEEPDSTLLVPAKKEIGWGVEKVRAPELWAGAKGSIATGKGILVGIVDTGVNVTHPDIVNAVYKNPGESGLDKNGQDKARNGVDDDNNGYVDDFQGWNFEDNNNDVTDSHGHGSKVAGIIAGNGTKGVQTGIAPGATILPIRSCCNSGTGVFESNTWEGLQYAVTQKVRVISMSLTAKHYSNPTYSKWREVGEVLLAAGLVHINSAGNLGSGSEPHNIGAPASNPPSWFHPSQKQVGGRTSMITIGATDQNDKVRDYSSVGPVTWEDIEQFSDYPYEKGKQSGLIKPDVCGPSETPSLAMTGDGYVSSFGGTSAATPHVAAVTTLLLSARPDLTVEQVHEALAMSAVQVVSPFNNQCGAGRVDAVEAVAYANSHFH